MPEGVYTVTTDLGVLTATLSFTVVHVQVTTEAPSVTIFQTFFSSEFILQLVKQAIQQK
jgi:hypothetical protein